MVFGMGDLQRRANGKGIVNMCRAALAVFALDGNAVDVGGVVPIAGAADQRVMANDRAAGGRLGVQFDVGAGLERRQGIAVFRAQQVFADSRGKLPDAGDHNAQIVLGQDKSSGNAGWAVVQFFLV